MLGYQRHSVSHVPGGQFQEGRDKVVGFFGPMTLRNYYCDSDCWLPEALPIVMRDGDSLVIHSGGVLTSILT